jgi:hypothetical protein
MRDSDRVDRLLENDEFYVWSPIDSTVIEKAEKAGVDVEATRPIGGWCSTEDLDRQDEVVVARGLDFNEFVQFGYFNDNHRQDTASVLGYPRVARLEKSRWWTEGNLLPGYPPADRVWELAKALAKSGAPRSLGFSIEGKVLERDGGNRIVRAKVRNVAITNAPVNTGCTWRILSKAFAPLDQVTSAARKALAKSQSMVQSRGAGGESQRVSIIHQRNDLLSFEEAVDRVRRIHPNVSKSACERVVRYAMNR